MAPRTTIQLIAKFIFNNLAKGENNSFKQNLMRGPEQRINMEACDLLFRQLTPGSR